MGSRIRRKRCSPTASTASIATSAIDARRLKTQDGYAPVPAKPTSLQREVRQNYE